MAITTTFAFRVRDMHRRGMTVARIAERLGASEEDVLEGHRVMSLPVNEAMELSTERSDAEREAELERMPKRMQDRIRRTKTSASWTRRMPSRRFSR